MAWPDLAFQRIVHLADLHIRNGPRRFAEYKEVIANLEATLRLDDVVQPDATLVVVAGDVFHNVSRVDGHAVELFMTFVRQVARLAPLVIIKGNHDDAACLTEPDIIKALLSSPPEGVMYLDQPGVHNVGTNLSLVYLPEEAEVNTDDESRTMVMLHHGRPPQKWGRCEIVLLGDIHLQQVISGAKSQRMTAMKKLGDTAFVMQSYGWTPGVPAVAYSGSLIQQDHGEPILGHGFLLWDLAARRVSACHVKNPYGLATLTKRPEDGELLIQLRVDEVATQWIPIQAVAKTQWMPTTLQVRLRSSDPDDLSLVTRVLQEVGLTPDSATLCAAAATAKTGGGARDAKDANDDFSDLTSPAMLIDYLSPMACEGGWCEQWQSWLGGDPTGLKVPDFIEASSRIADRNARILKRADAFAAGAKQRVSTKFSFRILSAQWAHVLCYGATNQFDFTQLGGKICCINAPNASGKTSFLEILCIGLYGQGFPSRVAAGSVRSVATRMTDIMCSTRPPDAQPFVDLKLELEGAGVVHVSRKLATNKCSVRADDGELIASGKAAVDRWVEDNVGSVDAFLLACIMSQGNDGDFTRMNQKDQRELIDRAMALDTFGLLVDMIKEASLAAEAVLAAIPEVRSEELEAGDEQSGITLSDVDLQATYDARRALQEEIESLTWQVRSVGDDIPKLLSTLPPPGGGDEADDWHQLQRELDAAVSMRERIPHTIQPQPLHLAAAEVRPLEELLQAVRRQSQDGLHASDECTAAVVLQRAEEEMKRLTTLTQDAGVAARLPQLRFEQDNISAVIKEKEERLLAAIRRVAPKELRVLRRPERVQMSILQLQTDEKEQVAEIERVLAIKAGIRSNQRTMHDELMSLVPLQARIDALRQAIIDDDSALQSTKTLPFNPECEACQQAPWKKHEARVREDRMKRQTELKQLQLRCHETAIQEIKDADTALEARLQSLDTQLAAARAALEDIRADIAWLSAQLEFTELQAQLTAEREHEQEVAAELNRVSDEQAQVQKRIWEAGHTIRRASVTIARRQLSHHAAVLDQRIWDTRSRMSRLLTALLPKAQRLAAARAELRKTEDMCVQIRAELSAHELQRQRRTQAIVRAEYRKALSERARTLTALLTGLAGYHGWLLETRVLPAVTRCANRIMAAACDASRALTLECELPAGSNTFMWYLKDGDLSRPPIEKASGFQRFICSLAVRIALGRLGAAGTRPRQLFIDEGFTACDADNLARVPEFLRGLLVSGAYETITVVSHLDTVRECADERVDIVRNNDATTSRLVWPFGESISLLTD